MQYTISPLNVMNYSLFQLLKTKLLIYSNLLQPELYVNVDKSAKIPWI